MPFCVITYIKNKTKLVGQPIIIATKRCLCTQVVYSNERSRTVFLTSLPVVLFYINTYKHIIYIYSCLSYTYDGVYNKLIYGIGTNRGSRSHVTNHLLFVYCHSLVMMAIILISLKTNSGVSGGLRA